MMDIEKLVSPAPDWTSETWAARMDQAASLLFVHGYISPSARSKITQRIEKQFRDGLASGAIVRAQGTSAGTAETERLRATPAGPVGTADAPEGASSHDD